MTISSLKEKLKHLSHHWRLLSSAQPTGSSFLQFLLVAGIGALVNLLALGLLLALKTPVRPAVASAIGVSVLSVAALNRRVPPSLALPSPGASPLLASVVLCSFGAIINYGVTIFLLTLFPHLPTLAAAGMGILGGAGVNYATLRSLFRPPSGSPLPGELGTGGRAARWIPPVGSALLLVLLAGWFLPQQCLWVDETTQLKGLTLGPVEVVRWLAGADRARFGVPGDRMPPLSYFVGMAWAGLFGLSETSLRWMGVCLAAAAAAVVARTAHRLGGLVGSLLAGLSFACSPNVVTEAVEIRAYPLFLLVSACSFLAFTRIVMDPKGYPGRWAAAFGFFLVASVYTHFYGTVLALSLGSACLLSVGLNRGRIRPVLVATFIAGLLSLGVFPFVLSSFEASTQPDPVGHSLRDLARLCYRFFGHPALGTNLWATAMALSGFLTLLGMSFFPRTESRGWIAALVGALGIGFLVTVGSGLVIKSFSTFNPSYSLWILPGLSILLSAATLVRWPKARFLSLAAFSLLLLSSGYASLTIDTHGTLFSHCPYGRLAPLVRKYRTGKNLVIHDGGAYGISYFPLVYGFGQELRQYVPDGSSPLRLVPLTFGCGLGPPVALETLEADRLIVVRTEWLSADELSRHLHGEGTPIVPGMMTRSLLESPEWRVVASDQIVAVAAAAVHVFERR